MSGKKTGIVTGDAAGLVQARLSPQLREDIRITVLQISA